jgi:hypothetical protein
MNIETEFINSIIKRFKEYKALGDKTFEQLSEEEMHFIPDDSSNSIAIIIQHLHGNMLSRWTNFLTEDGEKEWRKRDAEFEVEKLSKEELLQLWNEGWNLLLETLQSLQEDDLLKWITIRSQPLIVIDAINRQLAHYCSHIGQIVYLGKWIKRTDWKTLSIPKGGSKDFNEQLRL